MKNLIILLLVPLLFACGQSNFAKRKYTKGVYVEKRTHHQVRNNISSNSKPTVKNSKHHHSNNNEPIQKSDAIDELSKNIKNKEVSELTDEIQKDSEILDRGNPNEKEEGKDTQESSEKSNDEKDSKAKRTKHYKNAVISISLGFGSLLFLIIGTSIIFTGSIAMFIFLGLAVLVAISAIIISALTYKKEGINKGEKAMSITGLVLGVLVAIAALLLLILFIDIY